ncbi:MAG TPA: flagellar hook assembly protein FlgD [Noviherbaspirillum sp.]|uniref:flagellar hook assembly protein FlgD n=1 Tax=Noviherbaspirillum sp. TaxID=1926288 RepID=UPI002B4938E2|nr:flagellar hook assembly protein FlgD [Noviherbaspirillum sp.]HJV88482.1 flagellar hook assembly protein FlgD [Noviherbaspirillum sp.]
MSTVQTNNTVSSDLMATMNGTRSTTTSTAQEAQDRFMTLLVTQMKTQDPLNPLDNAQVTSQLAQLSTVTGIDKLNATLQALQGSYQASQSLQSADMIGHGVLVPGSTVNLANGSAVFGAQLTDPADDVKVTIRDSAGNVVHTADLGAQSAGVLPITWDGATDSGAAAANGKYSFEVTALRGGQRTTATALSFGQVSSVSTGAQGVSLNVSGVGSVNLGDIRQIL